MNMTTVTIKALRARGGLITWVYDSAKDCSRFWGKLCAQGAAPDTGEPLASAAYFTGTAVAPRKEWTATPEHSPLPKPSTDTGGG